MPGSPNGRLDGGAIGRWCARAFAAAPVVAGRLPSGRGSAHGEHTERALALRMGALVQQVPPFRALRALETVVTEGWADRAALRYASHAPIVLPFRGKAVDLRPTADGWVDIAPGRNKSQLHDVFDDAPKTSPMENVLLELVDRVHRYFAAHATVGLIGEMGAETGLARLCLLLAGFEAGVAPESGATVEQLHRGVPDDDVRELVGLVGQLRGAVGDLLGRAGTPLGVADPVFLRGWAEGDLVVGDTLIAVSLGDQAEVARRLRHLVAHAWLDVDDLYRVREVGVYLAVPGTLVTWPVAELAGQLLAGADPHAARAEFLALAEQRIKVPRPVRATDVTLEPKRDCVIVETTMPVPDIDAIDLLPDEALAIAVGKAPPLPGWSVTPNGPICPSRELAELALPFCAGLPDGWRLDYVEDPFGQSWPHWQVVKRRKVYSSSRANADGLAMISLFASIHEQRPAPKKKTPRAAPKSPTVYGPEVWNTVNDAEWTYWDLWFSVVCVADHGGNWDDLDAALFANSHNAESAEPMWSHLVDLTGRLSATGITAADLAGDLVDDRKTLAKARPKVMQRTGVRDKDLSPAMHDTPRRRYTTRAHFGSWDRYPVSPRPFYERLAQATPFDLEAPGWGLPTFENVDPLFAALDELEARHATDPPTLLAIRRAGLTASSLAHHRCNDSYGDLGEHTTAATLRFTRTDWRATGIDPAVFWRDILEIFTVLCNFGVAHRQEQELFPNLGADRDRALLKQIVDDLHASYLADRLNWPAREVKRLSGLI